MKDTKFTVKFTDNAEITVWKKNVREAAIYAAFERLEKGENSRIKSIYDNQHGNNFEGDLWFCNQ